ncbi:MAG: hybrid sensor histidine kinase/response regulator, partial [Anaerolineae bacterium]
GGQTTTSEVARLRQPGAALVWLAVGGAPIVDAAGRQLGAISTYTDVTELHDTQTRLQEANRHLRAQADELLAQKDELLRAGRALEAERERLAVTLRSIGDGVIATDAQGRIVLMNGVAETLTGWKEDEARGLPLGTAFHIVNERTGERVPDPVEQVLRSGLVVGLANHTELVARDGTRHALADSGAPIRTADGEVVGVVLVFQDVSMQRRFEEEVARANKLESLGLLAGGIAHDFNNLLTAILGNINLARLEVEDDRELGELLGEAEDAATRAKDLTQQLLTFARGGAPVRKRADLARVLVESGQFVLRGSKARHSFFIAEDLWPVHIDEAQIAQVIQNLVINADEAMHTGGNIIISAENVVVGSATALPVPTGPYVRVTVEDEGIGIPPENLPRVFDPYFTTKQKGSGLGLAVCYSVVNKHDGCITVESRSGEGTRISVYLPAVGVSAAGSSMAADERPSLGRVLVMDDEEVVRRVAERMLKKLGYEVQVADHGAAAVEHYCRARDRGEGFDVVLLDLTVLSGMGGREALLSLRRLDPDVRAIMSTGYTGGSLMARCAEYGFDAVIGKPYDMGELKVVLQQVLGHRHGSPSEGGK